MKPQQQSKRVTFNLSIIAGLIIVLVPLNVFSSDKKTSVDPSRKFRIVVFKLESYDVPKFVGSHFQSAIEDGFYNSSKYVLLNRDKTTLDKWKQELLLNKHCKTDQCAMQIAGRVMNADIAITGSALRHNNTYIITLKVNLIENLQIIYRLRKTYNNINAIFDDTHNIANILKKEIPTKYYKKDWFNDYEIAIRTAYMYNTGKYLESLRQGGWGGFITFSPYLNWFNFFFTGEIGYYQCRGKNYITDIAHNIPITIGGGYAFRPANKISISAVLAAGINISSLYHEKTENFIRGFSEEDNDYKTDANFIFRFNINTAYQFAYVKVFVDIGDYFSLQKNEIFQQVIFGLGVAYML